MPDAHLARAELRSLTTGVPIARTAKISIAGLFPLNITEAQIAQIDIRALIELSPEEVGVFVNLWDGSEFVESPVKLWDGSEFVDSEGVKTWNGASFV